MEYRFPKPNKNNKFFNKISFIKKFNMLCVFFLDCVDFFSRVFAVLFFFWFLFFVFYIFYTFSFFDIIRFSILFFFSFTLYFFVVLSFCFSFFLSYLLVLFDYFPFKLYPFREELPDPKDFIGKSTVKRIRTIQQRFRRLYRYSEKNRGFTRNTRRMRPCIRKLQSYLPLSKLKILSKRFSKVRKSLEFERRVIFELIADNVVYRKSQRRQHLKKRAWWWKFPFSKFGLKSANWTPQLGAYWWHQRWQKRKQEHFWTTIFLLYGSELLFFFELTLRYLIVLCIIGVLGHMLLDYCFRSELFFKARPDDPVPSSDIITEHRIRLYTIFFKRYYRILVLRRIKKLKSFVRFFFKFFTK